MFINGEGHPQPYTAPYEGNDVPCWSITALIDIIKSATTGSVKIETRDLEYGVYSRVLQEDGSKVIIMTSGPTIIGALFNHIEKIHEIKLL